MRALAVIWLISIFCYAQSDLSSTSAGDSVPTDTNKSEALQANANPIVSRHRAEIGKLGLTPMDFLNKFAVWKKASESRGATSPELFGSVLKEPLATTSAGPAAADLLDVEVESFLVAYKLSSELNLHFKDVVAARRNARSLTDALKFVAQREKRNELIPQIDSLVYQTAIHLK